MEETGLAPNNKCIRCREEIKPDAKVCPHCLRWQSKWAYEPYSPQTVGVSLGFLILFAAVMLGVVWFTEQPNKDPSLGFSEALSVSVTEVVNVSDPDGDYVAVLAAITNSSNEAWNNIHFQVDFSNQAGVLIDSWVDRDYDLVIPPTAEVRFRMTRTAIRPFSDYANASISILSATRYSNFGK